MGVNTKATIQLTPYEAVGHYFMLGGEPLDVKSYPYLKAVLNTRCPEVGLFTARQVAKCCPLSTYVVLCDGQLKTMADISVGDTVCATGPDFKSTARKVVGLYDNGEAECFEVTTKGGAVLHLTADHRLRTALGYTAVRDLTIDDTVAAAETAGMFLDLVPDGGETRIKLTAYMLGDGCNGMSGTCSFTKASSECLDEVLSLDPTNTHLQHKAGTVAKAINFRVDAPIRKWIEQDGGAGKYSYEKSIPEWVFKLSRKHTAMFLSRLWATDGSITSNGHTIACNYVSTSEILLRQVQSLLRKLGIRSTRDSFIPKYKGNAYRTAYRVRIAGYDALLRFYAELGHVPGRPAVYTTITTERRSTTITAPLAVNDLLRAAYAPFSAIPKRNRTGGIFDRGLKWPAGRLSQDKLREWIEAFKEMNLDTSALEPFDNGGVWWDTIDSIKSIGVQRVYDMEVEEDHNYLIDTGIVSHNSTTLAMKLVLKAINEPQSSQIYIAPLQDQAEVFSMQRLRDFILDSPIVKDGFFAGPGVVDQVFRKIFSNRSIIACGYAQRTADRLRGRSCGSILLDESFCKYSTYVETERGVTRIDKIKIGDKVWSFDQKNKVHTLDTVVRVLDHGQKITWKLTYDDGTYLYATSGSRFLTESGWVYLHELVDTLLNANAAADPHGQHALPPQGEFLHGSSYLGTEDSVESGMGRVELCVQHAYFATLRFHASDLFSQRARKALATEGSNASVAGLTDVGGDSLLVHGRRESEQSVYREYCDARFFQTRELSSGLVVVLERDRDGGATNGAWHQSLLLSSPESRSFPALHRQDSLVYDPVYDVQNSDQSSANSRMHDVRLIIPASKHGSIGQRSLLPSRCLSGTTQSELPTTSARYLQPDCGCERTSQATKTTEKGAKLVSIEFAGYRDVFDLETEVHHNFYANGILTHNCQDIMAEVIPIIKEMAFRVKNPSYWYCGTPKSFNNHMEAMRARSTGNEWGVKCQHTGCKKWNLNWNEKNIGNLGVICEHCGLPLNTDAGQWIASRRMDIEKGKDAKVTMESFRIPQLIVKPIMDIPRKWIEIIGKLKNYSAEQFNNEVLGLPFDSGSQPITLEQLMACCISTRPNVLPDPRDTSLPPLVMGVDWAFIGENSYTVVVIGGWEPYPTKFNVYYYHIYKGVETDSTRQENDIITMARSLGIRLIGADWGAGHVQNLHLINALGEEHVAQLWHTGMNGAARKAQRAKWEPKTRKWHLARTAVLTDTFENLRRRQVTLPRYEECVEFCDQILAESLEFNDKTNTVRYVNMNPDDCLHALTYAMLAGELLIRGDFAGHDGQASPEMPGSRKPDIGTEDDWGVGHEMYG